MTIGMREPVVDIILADVKAELAKALSKFARCQSSAHEGYAVLKEEVDELWDLVKADMGYTGHARTEAIQVAAMAVRYILDLNPSDAPRA